MAELFVQPTASVHAGRVPIAYLYAIGIQQGGVSPVGWTGTAGTSVTRTGLTLAVGTTYYFSVKAVNTASLESNAANSDGQVVLDINDTTPPVDIAQVRDGTGSDIGSTYSTSQLSANWSASTDSDSGISGYKYAIGTRPAWTDAVGWTNNSTTSVTRTSMTLAVGTTYYFMVKAVNGKMLESNAANSDGQVVLQPQDTTPPVNIAQVNDGTGADIDSITSTTELSVNWSASSDPESGITRYWYAIGTIKGGTDTAGWASTINGAVTSVLRTNLTLTVGSTYYFSVKAENAIGLQSQATNSDGQCVLATAAVLPKNFDKVKVWPNPFVPKAGSQMRFTNMPSDSALKIYTLSGKLVSSLKESGGEIDWDGKNIDKQPISKGLYIYIATDRQGNKKTGKIAITK